MTLIADTGAIYACYDRSDQHHGAVKALLTGVDEKLHVPALVLAELEVEGLEQLAVLVFWGDDLYLVVDLVTEQLQRIFRYGCGCGDHFTKVEQCLYQCCWIRTDLLSEVRKGSATTQADGLALAIWQAHAAYDVLLLLFKLMALLPLRLLALAWCATWTAECTGGTAATPTASTGQPVARRSGSPSRPITPAPAGRELPPGYAGQPRPDPLRRPAPPVQQPAQRNGRQSPNYQR